jgi:hypothetical protein
MVTITDPMKFETSGSRVEQAALEAPPFSVSPRYWIFDLNTEHKQHHAMGKKVSRLRLPRGSGVCGRAAATNRSRLCSGIVVVSLYHRRGLIVGEFPLQAAQTKPSDVLPR